MCSPPLIMQADSALRVLRALIDKHAASMVQFVVLIKVQWLAVMSAPSLMHVR